MLNGTTLYTQIESIFKRIVQFSIHFQLRNHARPDYREPRPQFEEDAPQPVRRPHHESYQAKPKQHHPNEHDVSFFERKFFFVFVRGKDFN